MWGRRGEAVLPGAGEEDGAEADGPPGIAPGLSELVLAGLQGAPGGPVQQGAAPPRGLPQILLPGTVCLSPTPWLRLRPEQVGARRAGGQRGRDSSGWRLGGELVLGCGKGREEPLKLGPGPKRLPPTEMFPFLPPRMASCSGQLREVSSESALSPPLGEPIP